MSDCRLDVFLKDNKGFSRQLSKELVVEGSVKVDGRVITKPAFIVKPESLVEIAESKLLRYVGRGGLKLEAAINTFKLDLKDKTCLDIGASTGGFTDCMLSFGAKKCYAVDVGSNQLDDKLKNDTRVISIENTNINDLPPLDDKIDFIGVDVSFVSLTKIIEAAVRHLDENGVMVVLIKPQFEVGREGLGKNGIVKDKRDHRRVLKSVTDCFNSLKLGLNGITFSPVRGGSGNIEYLACFSKNSKSIVFSADELVNQAYKYHKE